jgi:hypothetical protein
MKKAHQIIHPAVILKSKTPIPQPTESPVMKPEWSKWRAKFPYAPQREDEMALQTGDIIYCICVYDDSWASGKI